MAEEFNPQYGDEIEVRSSLANSPFNSWVKRIFMFQTPDGKIWCTTKQTNGTAIAWNVMRPIPINTTKEMGLGEFLIKLQEIDHIIDRLGADENTKTITVSIDLPADASMNFIIKRNTI